jgi:hypothetical protein
MIEIAHLEAILIDNFSREKDQYSQKLSWESSPALWRIISTDMSNALAILGLHRIAVIVLFVTSTVRSSMLAGTFFCFIFMASHAGILSPPVTRGHSFGSTCTPVVAVAGQKLPWFWWESRSTLRMNSVRCLTPKIPEYVAPDPQPWHVPADFTHKSNRKV